MSISYADDDKPTALKRTSTVLVTLMLVNAAFAFFMLFAWKLVGIFVTEPLSWATWAPVYRGSSYEDIIRYPFIVLWLWPVIGVLGAWGSMKISKPQLAYAFATMPIAVLSLLFGWYYLTPQEWH